MTRRATAATATARRAVCAAALWCVLLTVGGCSPADVIAFLGGCKDQSGTATAAASGSGEWTSLVGLTEAQVKNKWPDSVSYCSTYNYGFQCTWWACMRQKSLGHEIGQYWGNGNQWGASAKAAGWKEGAAAGGIVSYAAGAAGADLYYGHVAVIEQVEGDTVHITEGGTGFGGVHHTTHSASHPPSGVSYWHPDGSGSSSPSGSGQSSDTVSTAWSCAAASGAADAGYTGDGTHASAEQAQSIAKQMIATGYREWDNATDWEALVWIWNHESGWRWDAENPSSGAYGIPQALPASKLASAGSDWKDNAATQIKWGLNYIASRYGSPGQAKAFWQTHNWY